MKSFGRGCERMNLDLDVMHREFPLKLILPKEHSCDKPKKYKSN